MKLDRGTYEAWMLDRIEGKLTPRQEQELDAFLAANLDLDASPGELPVVTDDTMPFALKDDLKKTFPPVGEIDASRLTEFLVALHEGDLAGPAAMDLERYLYEHPEAAREVRLMKATHVADDAVPFPEKESIARYFPPQGSPDKYRLTDFLIAAQEGDLTVAQREALTRYVQAHPEAQRDERLVSAARIQAEPVVFVGKEQLKKKEGRVVGLWQRYAMAASIALLLGFAWWMMRGGATEGPAIARTGSKRPQEQKQGAPTTVEQPSSQGTGAVKENEKSAVPESHQQQDPERVNGDGTGIPKKAGTPRQEQMPLRAPVPAEELAPAPEQQLANDPRPHKVEQPEAPLLAQDPVVPAPEQVNVQEPTASNPMATARSIETGTPVGTALANAVRGGVIDSEKRDASLDGSDALAAVNKGLGAITGGQGRMQVERGATRERWKLRLGRNLAISASTGR